VAQWDGEREGCDRLTPSDVGPGPTMVRRAPVRRVAWAKHRRRAGDHRRGGPFREFLATQLATSRFEHHALGDEFVDLGLAVSRFAEHPTGVLSK
jgi:hypothetical protein